MSVCPMDLAWSHDPDHLRSPILRKAPSHFVTWGDGSADEMCLGLSWISTTLPNSHDPL